MSKIKPTDVVTVTVTFDPPLSKTEAVLFKQELMACAKGLLKSADMEGKVYGKIEGLST